MSVCENADLICDQARWPNPNIASGRYRSYLCDSYRDRNRSMGKYQPTVTIVTPAYNHERYIGRAIESVLAQTYPRWHMVIVDDGSRDNTENVVRRYSDQRIKYIRLEHRGLARLAETYNTALAASDGELVAVLEGDDYWPETKLEKQVGVFADDDVLLSWGKGALVEEDGKVFHIVSTVRTKADAYYLDASDIVEMLLRINVFVPTVTVMIRRSSLDRIGGFNQLGTEILVDIPTWIRLLATQEGRVCFVNDVLGYWRQHPEQTTRRRVDDMTLGVGRIAHAVLESLDGANAKNLQWTPKVERSIRASNLLADGKRLLMSGEYSQARRRFSDAFRCALSKHERTSAACGYVSSLIRMDLYPIMRMLRYRMGAEYYIDGLRSTRDR